MYNNICIQSIEVEVIEAGVCTKISVQSIITLVSGYTFLKQTGRFAYNCPLDGQIIKQLNSFDYSFVHVTITFDKLYQIHGISMLNFPSRCNLIMISRNSCSNENFFGFLSINWWQVI